MTHENSEPPAELQHGKVDKPSEDNRWETPTMQWKHLTKAAAVVRGRLFPRGRIVATPGAVEYMKRNLISPAELLYLHQTGDWGDLGAEDKAENALSVAQGFRILSCYRRGPLQEAVWVSTLCNEPFLSSDRSLAHRPTLAVGAL